MFDLFIRRCASGERDVAREDVRGYVAGLHSSRLGTAEILRLADQRSRCPDAEGSREARKGRSERDTG